MISPQKTFLRMTAAVLGTLALAVVAACSSAAADQCQSGTTGDLDCETILGVASGQAFCDNGTCRDKGNAPPAQSDKDAGPTASPCVSTEQCTAENGNLPSICQAPGIKPCVPLANADCSVSGDGWKQAKNPIFIGVLLATTDITGAVQPYSVTNEKGIQMAEAEWLAQTTGGLNVGGERRPIVNIYCDIKLDADTARRDFDLVTLGAGAPAVIAETPDEVAFFLDAAQARGTFVYLTEYGCDDLAASGKLNGVCYTNGPPFDYGLPLMTEWVKSNEAQARTARGLAATDHVKAVLLASRTSAANSTYIDALNAGLVLNGAAVATQPTLYKEINPQVLPDGSIDYVKTAQLVTEFAPDIIVTLEARDFHLWYLPLIEAGWNDALAYRPFYVGTDNISIASRYAVSVGGNEPLRHRISGIWPADDAAVVPVLNDFLTRYQARYGEPNTDEVVSGYDAFNATAYGIAAALSTATVQAGTMKGTDIGTGIKRLGSGTTTNLVPSTIPTALATLANGGSIDLVGADTSMDWDAVNGCPEQDSSVFCIERQTGQSLDVDDLGVFYRHKTKAYDPTLPITGSCP